MKEKALAIAVAVAALIIVASAALLSHSWGADGLDPLYLILALAVIALALPRTRDWLQEVSNLKLPGGIEVTREVRDAVAASELLPNVDDERAEKRSGTNRLLPEDWRKDPEAAVALLQDKLSGRLDWVRREFYDGAKRPPSETIEKLSQERLILPFEARMATVIDEISMRQVKKEFGAGGKTMAAATQFVDEADRVIRQLRLSALDAHVRRSVKEMGLKVLDMAGQPNRRWPDFYVFDADQLGKPAIKVAVRMARTEKSTLVREVRGRMRAKWLESSLDAEAQRVIVFPKTSKTEPEDDAQIPALKRDEFLDWLADYMAG